MKLCLVQLERASPALLEAALAAFPPARREEIGRLKNAGARAQRTVGEALLRLEARRTLGLDVTIARTGAGKPFFAEAPRLCFNLSHSGNAVVCGFGDSPLGVDVELCAPREFSPIAERCFSAAEREEIASSDDPLRAFYLFWTRRESVLKKRGEGFSALRGLDTDGERIFSYGLTGAMELCPVGGFSGEYLLSVCSAEGEPSQIIAREADDVLRGYTGK